MTSRIESIKVNTADPGYCATDLNGRTGHRTPVQGAAVVAGVAVLGDDGPTGAFIAEDRARALVSPAVRSCTAAA